MTLSQCQQRVAEFHEKAGCTINTVPTGNISDEDKALRIRLIHEEGIIELTEALEAEDPVKIADALADLLYVTLGTAVTCGIPLEACFNEVHRSNMSKFIDGHRREDGKWIKGESYSPANLEPLLKPFTVDWESLRNNSSRFLYVAISPSGRVYGFEKKPRAVQEGEFNGWMDEDFTTGCELYLSVILEGLPCDWRSSLRIRPGKEGV